MPKIGSAPKPARREEEALSSAIILPFRLRASRSDDETTGKAAPVVAIESNPEFPKRRKRKAAGILSADRLAILTPQKKSRLQQALIAAVLLHFIAFAIMHFQFINDVERAANSGGAQTADGTAVIELDIVVDAKLPSAKTPTNMTSPDATEQTNTPPQIKLEEKPKETQKAEQALNKAQTFALPTEELAAPRKSETAAAAQSPNQEKEDTTKLEQQKLEKQKTEQQKKKQEQATPSIAAAPNRAAATNTNSNRQTGANGAVDNGGTANVSSYNAMVLAHLQRFRVYPEQARAAKIIGVATVRFTISASGSVVGVSLAGSSGASVLDQAAVSMVQRASPFPPIPASLARGSMSFAAPVRFNVR
jgi:protein TonB